MGRSSADAARRNTCDERKLMAAIPAYLPITFASVSYTHLSAVVQFRGQDLLCRIDDNGLKFPSRSQFTEPDEAFTYLFELDGREYYLLFDENERALDGYSYRNIGLFRTEKPKELAYAAVSAWHLCSWYRDARYCGRCGEKLVHDGNERMMRCV